MDIWSYFEGEVLKRRHKKSFVLEVKMCENRVRGLEMCNDLVLANQ